LTYVTGTTMSEFLEDGREIHQVDILSHHFVVTTAEEDFNPEKKTLFATKLWEGAKVISIRA
jgi:hypothetical protein